MEKRASGTEIDLLMPCGLGRRALAMLYDALLIVALLMVAGAIALPLTGGAHQAFRDVIYTLYLFAVWYAYLGWCWTHGGQTLGMRAWKVRIQDADGRPVGALVSLVRFLTSLLAALPAGAGFLIALGRPDRACWHDLISGTRLIRER